MSHGYKQTDVGMIPEEWEERSVASVCKLINGRGFKPHEWKRSGLPIIRIQNLNGSEEFNYFEGPYAKKLEVENGQLLFAWSGSRGTSFGPHIWNGPLGLLNYHTWKVQVDECAISKDFFLHALKKLTKFIEDRAHGASALVHTQKWEMEGFKFPVPPTPIEQRTIANALNDVDALLNALDRLIAKKRDLKQATMQQLLTGQVRLPGFRGEWARAVLGNLLTMRATYGIVTAGNFKSTGVPMVRGGDIKKGQIGNDLPFISQEKSSEYSRTILKIGDVLIALVGYPGEAAKVPARLEGANISRAVGLLRLNKLIAPDYLVSYLNSPMGRRMVIAPSAGSAQQVVNLAALNKLEFLLPPPSEQIAIADILTDMDIELVTLMQQREKTHALKQGMMQELLTGKTRLIP